MEWWYEWDGGGEVDEGLWLSESQNELWAANASRSRCLSVSVRSQAKGFRGSAILPFAGRAPNSFSPACRGHVPELLFPLWKSSRPDGQDGHSSRSSSTWDLSPIENANLAIQPFN